MSKRRRKNRAAPALIACLTAAVVIMLILYFAVFVVRDIRFEGTSDVEEKQLIRASGIAYGKSIFSVDKAGAKEGIDQLGSVVAEDVHTVLPSTVYVTVRTRPREAMALYQNSILLLDGEGIVAERRANIPQNSLPYVSGFNIVSCVPGEKLRTDEKQLEAYGVVIAALNACDADACVSEIDLKDISDLRITTPTGLDVLLGDTSNMEMKIGLMKSAVTDLNREGIVIGTLDITSGTKADYAKLG